MGEHELEVATTAWRTLVDRLGALGDELPHQPFPQGTRESSDGYRYLGRLVVLGLQWAVEFGDPDFPAFYRHDDDITKWGGPNVDNRYLRARVRGDASYRITGHFRSSHGCVISLHEGDMQLEQYGVYGEVWADELDPEVDGSFELTVSPLRHGRNWLAMHPDTTNITIREYFHDWDRDVPGHFHVERISEGPLHPAPLDPATIASRLADAQRWIDRSFHYWNTYMDRSRQRVGGVGLLPPQSTPGGSAHIAYGAGFYELAPEEAMVIECTPPDAWTWNWLIYNLGWFESLDIANATTSLNATQIRVDGDGRYRLVVAHRDPGVNNWLDTTGLSQGMLSYRYIRTHSAPAPTWQVVRLDDLGSVLPSDTAKVTPDERARQLAARRRHVARRFRG